MADLLHLKLSYVGFGHNIRDFKDLAPSLFGFLFRLHSRKIGVRPFECRYSMMFVLYFFLLQMYYLLVLV